MKSAYELAMERLKAADPDHKPLSDEQKAKLADIEQRFKAKKAEREIFLKNQIAKAMGKGQMDEVGKIERQLRDDLRGLEEDLEKEKEKIRAD